MIMLWSPLNVPSVLYGWSDLQTIKQMNPLYVLKYL